MSQSSVSQSPVLELKGISKFFPGVKALTDVDFSLNPGEIHALIGENGAGKSTLMKIIGGVQQPDAGAVFLGGSKTVVESVQRATELGIAFVHQELILLDTSASMGFGSQEVHKLDYARFVAASLCYLANEQRDAAGLIVFDEDVQNYIAPSTRQGQLFRLLHAIEKAEAGETKKTDFAKPFAHFQNFLHRRGLVVVLSDFYARPEDIIRTVEPLRYRGNEVILFHLLDPQELDPKFREPVLLVDMENRSDALEVSPEYANHEYKRKVNAHIEALGSKARGSGIDYFLMNTARPLDEGLREYLSIRQGRL